MMRKKLLSILFIASNFGYTFAQTATIEFVFPYRSETIAALEWVTKQDPHWKFKYYLGLIYWGKNRQSEATKLMSSCGADPDDAVFYLTRASMSSVDGSDALQDLQQAMNLVDKGNYRKALSLLEEAKLWPERLGVGMPYTPDNRQIDYLQAVCYQKLNDSYDQDIHQNGLEDYVVTDKDPIGYELLERMLQYSNQ